MGTTLTAAIAAAHRNAGRQLRAVDYLRVSTEDQTQGYGIAYTGKRTATHITKKQWAHIDTFKDEGESGTLPWQDRPGAKRIMDLAVQSPRPFDVVVVYETRAVGRKNRVFWEWVWKLQDVGVFVAVVDEDIDNTTEDGEARMREKANESFKELTRIRQRTQGGIQEKAVDGGHPGGQARYGYYIEDQGKKGLSRLALDLCDDGPRCTRRGECTTIHEAVVLRRARVLVVQHRGNWRKAAMALNLERQLTRSGKPWSHPNLRSRLMDEDLLNARYVFRKAKNAALDGQGNPLWGESVTIDLDPVFTPDEVTELRRATRNSARSSTAPGRTYTLSKRIKSLCGRHYVGGSPAGAATWHYRCTGKSEPFPGGPQCSCPQLNGAGVEEWAWEAVCDLLGDAERLQALASEWVGLTAGQQVDYSVRLAALDQQVAEQDDTITLTTVMASRQVTRKGLQGAEAEAAVARILRPLTDELELLEQQRGEVLAWQAETAETAGRARDLAALAAMAHGRLTHMGAAQQAEFLSLLDVRITITGPPPPMRKGAACSLGEWFREHQRLIPVLDDQAWAAVATLVGEQHRATLDALLCKARTGRPWAEVEREHGSRQLRVYWPRWNASGLWEKIMAALPEEGTPAARRHPLPPMELRGVVKPGIIASEGYAQKSDPSEQFSDVAYRFSVSIAS